VFDLSLAIDSAPPMELRKPEANLRGLPAAAELTGKEPIDSAPPLELPKPENPVFSTELSGFLTEYLNDSAPPLCADRSVVDWLKVSPENGPQFFSTLILGPRGREKGKFGRCSCRTLTQFVNP
jgi:hypothetical protein